LHQPSGGAERMKRRLVGTTKIHYIFSVAKYLH
jgi:hypothetical protein